MRIPTVIDLESLRFRRLEWPGSDVGTTIGFWTLTLKVSLITWIMNYDASLAETYGLQVDPSLY